MTSKFFFLLVIIYLFCIHSVLAQFLYLKNYDPKARTATAIGTLKSNHPASTHYSTSHSSISFQVGDTEHLIWLSFDINTSAYLIGDHMIVKYDPTNYKNAKPILEKPYFAKGELPDTTEGVLHSISADGCTISYKTFDPSDSLAEIMKSKYRYLSAHMLRSLPIKAHCVYKVIYNKNDRTGSNKVEILFNEIIDSTHQQLNKYLFYALERISKSTPTGAIKALNKCIALDPQNKYYYFEKGRAHQKLHEYKKALESFSKYIQMGPGDKRGYIRRATLFILMGDIEAAQKDVNTVFALSPDNDEAYYLQGVIYFSKKEYLNAANSYTNALHHRNQINNEVCYYDRAVAEAKLSGEKNIDSKNDFEKARLEAKYNHVHKLHGLKTHPLALHHHERNFYFTISSDNSYATTSAISANMQGELIFPYTYTSSNQTSTFDKTFSLNTSKQSHSFSLGTLSLETGNLKRLYGRVETAVVLNSGKGMPGLVKSVLGYNIKCTKEDIFILRPEIGLSYLDRNHTIDKIALNDSSSITIMGREFKNSPTKYSKTDAVRVSLHEAVFNLSPAIGVWLLPYRSKFVMRLSAGYNWTLSQKYTVDFQNNSGTALKEQLNNVNIQFSNTNGNTSKFFNYQGPFITIGIGYRIR